jgi:hypothetical protein
MARNRAGVYPYERKGQTLYRTVFRDSAGRQRQKRGFTSPTAAAKYRAEMMVRADRGELRTTRQRFDEWLRGHHAVAAGPRARLSAITVQLVKDFVAEQVEQVEAGDLAPKTVNNSLACLSTCMKEAVALGKLPANPCDHVSHLPERRI